MEIILNIFQYGRVVVVQLALESVVAKAVFLLGAISVQLSMFETN